MQIIMKAFVGAILASFVSSATAAQCTVTAEMDTTYVGAGTSKITVTQDGNEIGRKDSIMCQTSTINMIDAGLPHPVDLHVFCESNHIR